MSISAPNPDVVIIGAGPYGLSLAAHLRARGVNFRIFGIPMGFWRDLPAGINLKSPASSTNISVPKTPVTFSEWCRERSLEDYEPCSMESFANYGLWIQAHFVPNVELTKVTAIARTDRGFDITLDDGSELSAPHVIVATGLSYLDAIPAAFRELPQEISKHTFHLSDYSEYRGKRVAIVGGGASAIEAGALVHEAGGFPEVFIREPNVLIYDRTPRYRSLRERILQPSSPIGNGKVPFLIGHFPQLPFLLPEARRLRLLSAFVPPSAPWWIKDRVVGVVPMHVASSIAGARTLDHGLSLTIRQQDQPEREQDFDAIIWGTGYEKDVSRLSFLSGDILRTMTLIEQAPKLSINFESSVGGLYFIGPMSEMSFGPITRFVAGAGFTAKSLSRHLARRVPKRRSVQPLQQQASIPRLDDRVRQQRADPMDVKIDERLT